MKNDKFGKDDYTPRWGPNDKLPKQTKRQLNPEEKRKRRIDIAYKSFTQTYSQNFFSPITDQQTEDAFYEVETYRLFPVRANGVSFEKAYKDTPYVNVESLINYYKKSFGYNNKQIYNLLAKNDNIDYFSKALWSPPSPAKGASTKGMGASFHPASSAGVAATTKAATDAKMKADKNGLYSKGNQTMQGMQGLGEAYANLAAMNNHGILSEHSNSADVEHRSPQEAAHWKYMHGLKDSRSMNIGLANNGTGQWGSKVGATPIVKINDHEGHEQIFAHHPTHGWVPSHGIAQDKTTGKDVVGFHTGEMGDYHRNIANHLNTFVPGHLFRDEKNHEKIGNLNLTLGNGRDELHQNGLEHANTAEKVRNFTSKFNDKKRGYLASDPTNPAKTIRLQPNVFGHEGWTTDRDSADIKGKPAGFAERAILNEGHMQDIASGKRKHFSKNADPKMTGDPKLGPKSKTFMDHANTYFRDLRHGKRKKRVKAGWHGLDTFENNNDASYGAFSF